MGTASGGSRSVHLAGVVTALLIAGVLLAAVLVRMWWSEASRTYERSVEDRSRVERCPVVEGARVRVDLGGWGDPDFCVYTHPDGTSASESVVASQTGA